MVVKVEFWPEFGGKGPIRIFPVLDEALLEQELGKEFGELVATDRADPIRQWVLSMGGELDSPELRAQQELGEL